MTQGKTFPLTIFPHKFYSNRNNYGCQFGAYTSRPLLFFLDVFTFIYIYKYRNVPLYNTPSLSKAHFLY